MFGKREKTWEVWNLCCHQGRRRPSRGLRSRRESTKQSNFGLTQIFKYSSLLVSSNVWSLLDLTLLSSLTNDGIFPRGGSAKAAEKRKERISHFLINCINLDHQRYQMITSSTLWLLPTIRIKRIIPAVVLPTRMLPEIQRSGAMYFQDIISLQSAIFMFCSLLLWSRPFSLPTIRTKTFFITNSDVFVQIPWPHLAIITILTKYLIYPLTTCFDD